MNQPSEGLMDRARVWAEAANHAPSGDNSQPWVVSLRLDGNRVILTLHLDVATRTAPSFFDCAFSASYLSLGAFAENFSLMAASEGFAPGDLREDAGLFTLVFAPSTASGPGPAETAELIRRRTTNRLPFKKEALTADEHQSLVAAATTNGFTLQTFTGEEKTGLAGLFTALDRIRYQHRELYLEFLGKLRFGRESDKHPDGLRDMTLGVPAPSLLFLRLLRKLRNVRLVHGLFFIGLERIMAFFGCRFLIQNSAAVCVLSGGDDTPLGWFRLGQRFQAVWLEAARRRLALQPLGTTLFLYRLARAKNWGEAPAFAPGELARLLAFEARFRTEFALEFGRPAIAFRVGHAPEVANASLRRPLAIRS